MNILLVVSEHPGDGKTSISIALAHHISKLGKKVALVNPFGDTDELSDSSGASIFSDLLGSESLGWPLELPKSGLVDTRGRPYKVLRDVKSKLIELADKNDLVIAEISSEIPLSEKVIIAETLDAQVLGVIRHKHGLKVDDIKNQWNSFNNSLCGILINCRTKYTSHEVNMAFIPDLANLGVKVFGVIPEDRRLLSVTVDQIAKHLGGKYIVKNDEASGRLIENFLVGGWTMDESSIYFATKDNKAVITRGDRPDLQMSALTTDTTCIIMTKAIDPIEYVEYEAQNEGVPIIVVDTDTIKTMESLESLVELARFDHVAKLDRLSELIQSEVDTEAMLATIGIAT